MNETTRLRNTEARASESEDVHASRNQVDRLRNEQARAVVNRSVGVTANNWTFEYADKPALKM